MSIATKRRFITKMIESELVLPEKEDKVALILSTRGNNLHEVEDQNGNNYLVSMPTKFRKAVWIKRGKFVLVRPIKEGFKVKAEISHILDEENILYIRENKLWPERFESFALKMTRDSRRKSSLDINKKHSMIDSDMLPPSDSEDDCRDDEETEKKVNNEEDCESGDEVDYEGENERAITVVCNPNRGRL